MSDQPSPAPPPVEHADPFRALADWIRQTIGDQNESIRAWAGELRDKLEVAFRDAPESPPPEAEPAPDVTPAEPVAPVEQVVSEPPPPEPVPAPPAPVPPRPV